MTPSVLARQLQQGVEDFLRTTFPISTPHFHGMLERFLASVGTLFKGPYISLNLPFREGEGEGEYFPEVPLGFRPYLHQERAFERLGGERPRSTLISTGTGSGKTESFLLPILDHCRRHRDEPGIKAILVYPMNALANDQAGRIAELIGQNPNLHGVVRAGLYVGQSDAEPQSQMTEDGIITDKHTMRLHPPDILLTNYKMLDYLLVRPDDFPLWQHNGPETLRFLVVDELHTFDGAQGTDLACLIRRLKARLGTPEGHLCSVGTSATLGGEAGHRELIDYATTIFGEPFEDDAVITESRQTESEFLADALVRPLAPVQPELAEALDAEGYDDRESYLRAQIELWFGEELEIEAWEDAAWRVELGELLKSQPLFRNLLVVLEGGVKSLDEIQRGLSRATPELHETDLGYQRSLLDSLLALASAARVWAAEGGEDGERPTRPFLDVRVQLWLRELRRVLASVSDQPALAFFDDLTDGQRRDHLPVVHCRDCGSTGWGAIRRQHDEALQRDLESFYQGFFAESPNVTFLFPGEPEPNEGLAGRWLYLDSELRLSVREPDDEALSVFVPDNTRTRGGRVIGHHDCPYCRSQDGLTIMGSRAASLTSVLITQLYGSSFNDDKKLITFSDSVQDASHRAGFFGARTYRFTMRTALQQFVQEEGEGLQLEALPTAFRDYWLERMGPETYATTFIGPDMVWLHDYEHLITHGRFSPDSDLLELVDKRVAWEIYSEYGYRARIGRTLEKSNASIIHLDPERLDSVTDRLLTVLQNEIGGLRELERDRLKLFLIGLLSHLRTQGAIFQDALRQYIEDDGHTFRLNRQIYLPGVGPRSRLPVFLTPRRHSRFDPLVGQSLTWYEEWAEKCFDPVTPLVSGVLHTLYDHTLKSLVEHGVLKEETTTKRTLVWGIPPATFRVTREVIQLRCSRCGHSTSVARIERELWDDAPCIRQRCSGHYLEGGAELDYYGRLYSTGDVKRIVTREHTGLLEWSERETLEQEFIEGRYSWTPNLLSCTPTLEMGIDIGDLSTVALASIPPAQSNYIQRIGRAGRRDGNALNLAVANARPHDLYFYADPKEMITGVVDTPGVYLAAAAVLERQFTGYCLDRWVETELPPGAIPPQIRTVLDALQSDERKIFPYPFIEFVSGRHAALADGFLELFGDELGDAVREHIRWFAGEDGAVEGTFEYKLIDGLYNLLREREALKKTVQRLNRQIRKMRDQEVRDQNYEKELGELKGERRALQRIITEKINRRHTLNFLTDEGLIPNYAFPEAGVTLRSVIYRQRGKERESGYETIVYEYERPAVSAISELAPHNRFYAGGRNVRIDQVDLNAADAERWRLCDACSYSALQIEGETPPTCPRCGSIQWGDSGQEHSMLRMRTVYARTSDRDSRTGDDYDDRRPVFFNKQLLVDYEESAVTSAFLLDDRELPFGFEFLSKTTFTEINFGEKDLDGPEVRIAGLEFVRRGFDICRHCGKVQNQRGPAEHGYGCPARESDDANDFINYLYLYRQFASEAIRVLLPETTFAGSDRTLHSFVAALQLGLRKKFRGSADHLRAATLEEPIPGTEHRKRSLVLYDTIPGGTGYLKELMLSPEPLLDILELALEALRSCTCNADDEADGCYSCLYAYRNAYEMAETSRDRAIELLSDVLRRRDRFTEVESLRRISGNTILESELEHRFIAALGEFEGVEVRSKIVHGKRGYFLEAGDESYQIVPQVALGTRDGVSVPSRADFVIYPTRARSGAMPIAVFTDGWSFHEDRIGMDMAQRMAIVQSGKYHVWSLTWNDVEHALAREPKHFQEYLAPRAALPSAGHYHQYVQGADPEANGAGTLRDLVGQGSFAWLVRYLQQPSEAVWRSYATVQLLLHTDPKIRTSEQKAEYRAELRDRLSDLIAETVLDLEPEIFGGYAPPSSPVRAFFAGPADAVQQHDLDRLALVYLLDEADAVREQEGFSESWNGFLRLYNLYQFLPRAIMLTTRGVGEGIFDAIALGLGADEVAPLDEAGVDTGWQEVRELTDPELYPLLDVLAEEAWGLPEVGYEPTGEHGAVLGMAELAWPSKKFALLYEEDLEYAPAFEEGGWTIDSLEDAVRDPSAFIERHAEAVIATIEEAD